MVFVAFTEGISYMFLAAKDHMFNKFLVVGQMVSCVFEVCSLFWCILGNGKWERAAITLSV